ncbi:zinc-ribbon domain-containing protein [Salinilacihabitans rarus]|nr:zinc-ribbon domain-containing protein [Salinilacihabitans rarus]
MSAGVEPGPGDGIACPECEAVVAEGSVYCSNCGAKLADAMAGP